MTQIARWTAIIALFAIPLLPLYVATDLYFPFITGKNFAFRILVEIALAAFVVLAVCDRRYRPQWSWILGVFGVFVAWMALANAFGINPEKAFWSNFERMDGWVTIAHLLAFFVVAGTVFRVDALWRKWLAVFVGGAALVCGYAIIQLGGGAEIHQGGVRLTATLGNAIYLAVYLMFAMFFAGLLALKEKGWIRYALIGFLPIAALILFFTASRGPLVGLLGGVGFGTGLWLILALRGKKDAAVRVGIRIAVAVIALVVFAVGALFVVRDSEFVQGNVFLGRIASVFNLSQELTVRGTIWGIALEGAQERPVIGYGQEGFSQVFNTHYKPSLYEQEMWFDRVHNTYLDWLVAGGVPAMVLFVVFLAFVALALLRAPGLGREERVLLLAALAAYAIQALVVFDNLFSYVPLVALAAIAHGVISKPVAVLQDASEVQSDTGRVVVAAVCGVGVALLIWFVNVPHIRAAQHLLEAVVVKKDSEKNYDLFERALADNSFATQEIREQLVVFATRIARDEQIPEETRKKFIERAIVEMEQEITRIPDQARNYTQYASALYLSGRTEDAVAALDEAIVRSPKKQSLHLARATRLSSLGRDTEARDALIYAYELDPSFDGMAMQVGAGLVLLGDSRTAEQLLVEHLGTDTPDSEPLFFAYYETKQWNKLIAVAKARVTSTGGSPESRLRLAQAFAASGRFVEARDEIAATAVAFPDVRDQAEALLTQLKAFR